MDFKIRNEESKDIEQIDAILRATFQTEAESKLVDALRANDKAIIALVAMNDDHPSGHILFSPVSTAPSSDAKGIGLAPVAVPPDLQSKGIGLGLIREGLRLCKELGYDYCVVLGNPKYYQRFGFEKASNSGLQNEYGVDDEFMVIHFSKCSIGHGLVKYASEFALFSV
jgi:putative acetyltransferase